MRMTIAVLIAVLMIWSVFYLSGFQVFNGNNSLPILTSIFEGMAALLSIAIAVIIFRVQSVDNRIHDLEKSTLDFILLISGMTYTGWTSDVEDGIHNKAFSNSYYRRRKSWLELTVPDSQIRSQKIEEYTRDRDAQQERLEKIGVELSKQRQRSHRVRKSFKFFMPFWILPIVIGLLWFMLSDAVDSFLNYSMISLLVLVSTSGIMLLIQIMLESIAED